MARPLFAVATSAYAVVASRLVPGNGVGLLQPPRPVSLASLPMRRIVSFEELRTSDLVVDAVYSGGARGNSGDDPLSRLLGCGNQGGFRIVGTARGGYRLAVLYTTGAEPDWPDELVLETGRFTYFGDNRSPGGELHRTKLGGNALMREAFSRLHGQPPDRVWIPPFFVFSRAGRGRDAVFRGLAVPGGPGTSPTEDLIAVWRTKGDTRFQNYQATFTILDVPVIARSWLTSLRSGLAALNEAPKAWQEWVEKGRYQPLIAPRAIQFRSQAEQLPRGADDLALVDTVRTHFADKPTDFEPFAARIWKMSAGDVTYTITRPSVDGGRDAFGEYLLGPSDDRIRLDFALEAKCYDHRTTSVGVSDMSRLISRLRHRQFGVLVTTSYVARQAYEEIREDRHPVIVLAARDIVDVLRKHGISGADELRVWLSREFPRPPVATSSS